MSTPQPTKHFLDKFQMQQAQDKEGTGQKVVVPERAMKANHREVPGDMPAGFWADLVWDMMSYKECSLRTAKIEVWKAVTGEYPGPELQPWAWGNECFWRTDA